MTLPASARVRAAANFRRTATAAYQFLVAQDPTTAAKRYRKLQADLAEARKLLAWSPAAGRPARFMAGSSGQGLQRAERVSELARMAGLPGLRELLVGRYVLLYAHSDTEAMLLALHHERQLAFDLG